MANVMKMHHKKTESQDTRSRNLFEMMGQGSNGHIFNGRKGLFQSMNQGRMKGEPAHVSPRPGKCAPSVGRSMGQGGK
jgi:hypothetical protein